VTKLRASTGATVGTFSVGNEPVAAAFDGANIWVSNFSGTTVSKL
jgi:Fe2+ transport system protein B